MELEIENKEGREDIIEQTKKEDERSDLKQHADKMLRDFEKFNDFSSNRAIWELVQNACDLSLHCEIVIDYRDNKIQFSHNGKAFTTKSLISLIKQVSGKYGDIEDIPEVGKYGTGFLTTHTFGRKFILNSFLDTGSYYLPIKDFVIDRRPKVWDSLSDNISDQKRNVFKILRSESPIEIEEFKTSFTYLPETAKEVEYIEKSILNLEDYIPLVFTINNRLKNVTVITKDNVINVYSLVNKYKVENDKQINLYKTIILKNDDEIHLYSLVDVEDEIEIILPISKEKEVIEFDHDIARLFLYYPLIGSHKFGINFIINCNKFLPTEPRNSIHLSSDKDQVKEDEEKNKQIIDKCTDIIFLFLKSNIIEVSNPLLYTNVNFKTNSDDQILNEYYEFLQIKWNEKLKELPFVKTLEGFKKIEEAIYLSKDFLTEDEKLFSIFYELISIFYTSIPLKDSVIKWSEHASNWNDDSIKFITHDDLVKKISENSLKDFNKDSLKSYYQHLVNIDKSSFFTQLRLLPNLDGIFNQLGHLLLGVDLSDTLIELGKILIPESISKLVHYDFKFDFTLTVFNRRDLSDDVKNKLDSKNLYESIYLPQNLNKDSYHIDLINKSDKIEENYFKALLRFCKLVNNVDSSSKPNQLLKKISQYYQIDNSLFILPNLKEDIENIEYRSIRKVLVKIFFNLISLHNNKWVEDNQDLLFEFCSLNDDSYKDVYKESKIYPNQLYELHAFESLKRDLGVKKDIKEIYFQVQKEDIEEVLSLERFNNFISEENSITNRNLSTIIEENLFRSDVNEIERHEFKDVILRIIPKLTDKEYQVLFPQLNDKKAGIMISVITKEETKDDIFAIVTLEDEKLRSIGRLISNPNFETILNKAIDVLEDENQTKANFKFKHQIGTHIEKKLKDHLKFVLNPEEIKCEILNEQDGQDIVIKIKNEIKYYIEVKSRWDKKTSIKMSKNQTIRSNEQKDNYALCSVDMTDYHGEDRYGISDINKVIDKIKFVNDIGVHVDHLVEVLKQSSEQDQIHLDGDYRTLVPQKIIDSLGRSFLEFESYLIDLLKY